MPLAAERTVAIVSALSGAQRVPSIPEVTLPALLIVPIAIGLALLFLMGRSRARARKRRPPT